LIILENKAQFTRKKKKKNKTKQDGQNKATETILLGPNINQTCYIF